MKRIMCIVALAAATIVPAGAPAAVPADDAFSVVRFGQTIRSEDRAALESTGARVIDYEPHNAYIVWADRASLERARALPGVRAIEPLSPNRKLHPEMRAGSADVTVYAPAFHALGATLSRIAPIESVRPARADGLIGTVSLVLPDARAIDAVVALPWVMYVNPSSRSAQLEDEATDQIQAGILNPTTRRPVPGYRAWLAGHGLSGKGIKVTVVDGGISRVHPDIADRIVASVDYTGQGSPETSGHGTHVAGIVGGDPKVGLFDPDTFTYGLGVAPEVLFMDQNAIAAGAPFPPLGGLQVLSRDAWRHGVRIWNASWTTSEGARVGYVANARVLDEMARNADFETAGAEELLLVFSAGNSGADGITSPKEAKNIIAVGATDSGRNLVGLLRTNGDTVSSFSSRGPALDGRIMPLLSAPGGNVVSAYQPGTTTARGACLPPPGGAPLYAACSGTSMAAPHVAGAAALIHEWWLRDHATIPSPTIVKAMLVNGTEDIGRADIPNRNEGWGRVNLSYVFSSTPFIASDQQTTFGDSGESSSALVTVPKPGEPLRVTVAWADTPGATGANPALVNDLDLVVEQLDALGTPVRTWYGNVFSGGISVEGGAPDRLNNVENVFLPSSEAATYRITVRAHNLPGDGVPFSGDETDQDYALFVRNAIPA